MATIGKWKKAKKSYVNEPYSMDEILCKNKDKIQSGKDLKKVAEHWVARFREKTTEDLHDETHNKDRENPS